jgi:hypothetical protein
MQVVKELISIIIFVFHLLKYPHYNKSNRYEGITSHSSPVLLQAIKK